MSDHFAVASFSWRLPDFVNFEALSGNLLDSKGEGRTHAEFRGHGFQNEHLQCALPQIDAFRHALPLFEIGENTRSNLFKKSMK
jgi:hypothetical protein